MDHAPLVISTLLAAATAAWGVRCVRRGVRSRWTLVGMSAVFACQFTFLIQRGQERGACPLRDSGEILAYLAWALTLFYLMVGPAYRISLLGVFTAPLVAFLQSIALLGGLFQEPVTRLAGSNPWRETHSALAVLAYGALALAAVAGVMFLVLDRMLKGRVAGGGLFRNLPPVRQLIDSLVRLLWIGTWMLTAGVVAGFLMPDGGHASHFVAATVVWIAYLALIAIHALRGMTARRLAVSTVVMFLLSLGVFALI